jgi:hypothetical protein
MEKNYFAGAKTATRNGYSGVPAKPRSKRRVASLLAEELAI